MSYDYKEIVPFLLDWFEYNARILIWRENPLPYYVWLSEIMLQQTRVEAVKSYFDRFIVELPDIKALAEADEEKLLKLWEGLGYYNRVRNLQKAAQMIVKDYNGELPPDYTELLKLPGIGIYTAGAIASIAFQISVPAVDGNVLRVTKRIAGSFDDISKDSVKKELWEDLKSVMPKEYPGNFNQSLMELGATVCIPNGKPLCDRCPVMHLCKAFHDDLADKIPVKPAKKERRLEDRTILLLEYQDSYAIRKRLGTGLLAGLWELPSLDGKLDMQELMITLEDWGIKVNTVEPMANSKHIFSHIEWHMAGYHIVIDDYPLEFLKENNYLWANREDMNYKYAVPNAFSAYSKYWKENK